MANYLETKAEPLLQSMGEPFQEFGANAAAFRSAPRGLHFTAKSAPEYMEYYRKLGDMPAYLAWSLLNSARYMLPIAAIGIPAGIGISVYNKLFQPKSPPVPPKNSQPQSRSNDASR